MIAPGDQCVLCALKHLTRARGLLKETAVGYAAYYWFALGELSLAEDHLPETPELAVEIREHRKQLELYPRYEVPFADLVVKLAAAGGYDVDKLLKDGEHLGEGQA